MSAFASAVDTLFADPNMSRSAEWVREADNSRTAVRVVVVQPDEETSFGRSAIKRETRGIRVRVSEIPSPKIGDTIELGSEVLEVKSSPLRDPHGLVWDVNVAKIA